MSGFDFDIEDAAIAGGILGFVEESSREEEEELYEELEDLIDNAEDLEFPSNIAIRLLRNENPDLVNHLFKRALESRAYAALMSNTEAREDIIKEIEEMQKEAGDNGDSS